MPAGARHKPQTVMLTLWIVSDGKPGHRNQSLGLAEAIGRLEPAHIEVIELAGGLLGRLGAALAAGARLPRPDVVIGAGHGTHLPLLALGWKFGAPTVVMMRPSLPVSWFDVCLVPRHDLKTRRAAKNVIPTVGALNRIVPTVGPRRPEGVFLIGGPQPADLPVLLDAVANIAAANPGLTWKLTDSRRTPAGFLTTLRLSGLPIEVHAHGATAGDWLPGELAGASEVWVTPDSVSMMHEALSCGARVGLLPCAHTVLAPRLAGALDQLRADGLLGDFARWQKFRILAAPDHPLAEADRCARLVVARLGLV